MRAYVYDRINNTWIQKNQIGTFIGMDKLFPGGMICVVGAGGKTSTCYELAREASGFSMTGDTDEEAGRQPVLITTTTHMMCDPKYGFLIPDELLHGEEPALWKWIFRLPWEERPFLLIGRDAHIENAPGKMCGIPENILERLAGDMLLTIVEGDGARRYPFKVPNDREPVVPPKAGIILILAGMSSPGRPIGEVCFRSELLPENLKARVKLPLTPQDMAYVLNKYYGEPLGRTHPEAEIFYVLNQTDTNEQLQEAKNLASMLGRDRTVITCYHENERRPVI